MVHQEISFYEKFLCSVVRKLHGSGRLTECIKKYSKKKYGRRDNLSRYYVCKYAGIYVGKYSYGWDDLNFGLLKSVGAFTSIAAGATLVPSNHKMDLCTTSPILTYKMFGFTDRDIVDEYYPNWMNSVEIGNDVWVGANAIIFNNVKIGDGAVIAANSVVRRDVPPYAVVGGIDRIIKYRFDKQTIDMLLKIKWWEWGDNKIKANLRYLYDPKKLINAYKKGEIKEG